MLFSRLSFGLFAAAAIATPMPSEHSIEKRDLTSDILYIHNHYRAAHHVGNLVWNADLATYAAQNANKCVFQHTPSGKYGENIAEGFPNTQAAAKAWGNEQTKYDYKGEFTEDTGHFTQMVWKATTRVGCAQKACGSAGTYLVCEYYPRGNIIGQFTQNVFPQ